ncbi:MAG: EAL domain-containing protein [Planctomycetota bacterium]
MTTIQFQGAQGPEVSSPPYKTWTQPIWDLATDTPIGFEILSRSDTGTAPTALASGDLGPADAWALEGDLVDLAASTLERLDISGCVFLNCTPSTVADDRLTERLVSFATRLGIECGTIVVEITEGKSDTEEPMVTRGALRLREAGFRLAVDDLGADGAGLARVAAIQPDWVKLDRRLVAQVDEETLAAKMIEAIAEFGLSAGIPLIAEGIERPNQLAVLRSMGLGFGQGYLLGMPRPAAMPLAA